MKSIILYVNEKGNCPFANWIKSLRDKVIVSRIQARLLRLEFGHFGDSKSVGGGVFELRLAFGSGYRIYYGKTGEKFIVLLIGGDKSTQKIDIKTAILYWNDYLRRVLNERE